MQKIFVILIFTLCCASATAQPIDRKLQRALETTMQGFHEVAISQVPPNIFVASKHGCVNASRSETLLVMAPNGPYIFSIITKDQADQSWEQSNEGWVLMRTISATFPNLYHSTTITRF